MKIAGKIRGQSFIPVMVIVTVLFMLALAAAEAGNVIYQKIKLQNAADSGALEGGIWYARTLNIASVSNKVLAGTVVLACFTGNAGGIKAAQKIQDIIIESAPYIASAAVVRNGKINGCLSVPVFNNSIVPAFNIERRTIKDVLESDAGFSYTKAGSGETVYVKKENVSFDPRIGKNGGYIYQSEDGKITRFVKKGITEEVEIPLDLVETGNGHTCFVMSFNRGYRPLFPGISGKKAAKLPFSAFSMTAISGGSLEITDIKGASYDVSIVKPAIPLLPEGFNAENYASWLSGDKGI